MFYFPENRNTEKNSGLSFTANHQQLSDMPHSRHTNPPFDTGFYILKTNFNDTRVTESVSLLEMMPKGDGTNC